jgi:hypothetical protein
VKQLTGEVDEVERYMQRQHKWDVSGKERVALRKAERTDSEIRK